MKITDTFLFLFSVKNWKAQPRQKRTINKSTKFINHLYVLCFCCMTSAPVFAQPYPKLTSDINWSPANFSTVDDIKAAFENGRNQENAQVLLPVDPPNISPTLTMPSQVDWDAKSNSEKALYLINAERVARGLLPLEGVHSSIITIAQTYAELLRDNDWFAHDKNGSPGDRLAPASCSDGAVSGENLATFVQSGGTVPLPVERSVYGWIYDDGPSWGHRNTCFALFFNNFGSMDHEGFIGIGLDAVGPPYSAEGTLCTNPPPNPPCDKWAVGVVIVYNYIDPCPTSPLPVELTSFTVSLIGSNVELNWQTATEVNNYGFELQRKISGSEMGNWNKIGFVNGNGNSNSPKSYSYSDKNLSSGTYYYRLKQVDNDGGFEYSNYIEVTVDAIPENFSLEQNFPNPFNPSTTISYGLPEAVFVKLSIYNIIGEEISILVNDMVEAGSYNITFDASNLPNGVYFYKLQYGNKFMVMKMLLTK